MTAEAQSLAVDVVEDDGDWGVLEDAEALIEACAQQVALAVRLPATQCNACVALSSDAKVAELNGVYRSKPKPTNVLSFPNASPHGSGAGPLGDIILALETVQREAGEQAIPLGHHVQHLVVHGLLHLLGFDHETDRDAEMMESLETDILARLGIADPYAPISDTAMPTPVDQTP